MGIAVTVNHNTKTTMRKSNKLLIQIYKDTARKWRWRMKRCGRILADSGEGYGRLTDLQRAVTHMIESLASDNYELVD